MSRQGAREISKRADNIEREERLSGKEIRNLQFVNSKVNHRFRRRSEQTRSALLEAKRKEEPLDPGKGQAITKVLRGKTLKGKGDVSIEKEIKRG